MKMASRLIRESEMWLRYRLMDIRGRGVYAHHANACQCIFIHIPKAAGSSISQTLFQQPSRHVPYFEYERASPRKFRKFFKFTFVRNPWDRLVSTYFFLKRGGVNQLDANWAVDHLSDYQNFEEFVHDGLRTDSVREWIHFRPQTYFIADAEGDIKVDFIGRFEKIERDFCLIEKKLGCEHELRKMNVGQHAHYRDYYTKETKKIVYDFYERDIELLQYLF
ncbi:sulfotransferase family 2 domain-containing protein [Thiohalocapsa marina]|nr:sulfotransferase family 2 domain-containing protein [Thiohalocapsa marina]